MNVITKLVVIKRVTSWGILHVSLIFTFFGFLLVVNSVELLVTKGKRDRIETITGNTGVSGINN